jgi:hypothetical protein
MPVNRIRHVVGGPFAVRDRALCASLDGAGREEVTRMNASTNTLRRTRIASVLLSVALLAVAAPTLVAGNPATTSACQAGGQCGG